MANFLGDTGSQRAAYPGSRKVKKAMQKTATPIQKKAMQKTATPIQKKAMQKTATPIQKKAMQKTATRKVK